MALLGGLGFLQRLVAAREIGAGVLPVAVQEQTVEAAAEVVVVGNVAPRAVRRIVLVDVALQLPQLWPDVRRWQLVAVRREIADQHVQHLVDAARVDGQGAVHVALADRQRRVQHQPADRAPRVQGNAGFRSGPAGIGVQAAVRPAHGETPDDDEPLQDRIKDRLHCSAPRRRTRYVTAWRMKGVTSKPSRALRAGPGEGLRGRIWGSVATVGGQVLWEVKFGAMVAHVRLTAVHEVLLAAPAPGGVVHGHDRLCVAGGPGAFWCKGL